MLELELAILELGLLELGTLELGTLELELGSLELGLLLDELLELDELLGMSQQHGNHPMARCTPLG